MNDSWTKPIIEQWKSLGIELNSGSTLSEIAKVEHQIGIHFTDDFKDLYIQINGFKDFDWTPTMFSLWPLNRIVDEYEHWEGTSEFVGFCDYLINMHRIGFVKNRSGIFKSYGNEKPSLIASSFSQAIDLINLDADIIYF